MSIMTKMPLFFMPTLMMVFIILIKNMIKINMRTLKQRKGFSQQFRTPLVNFINQMDHTSTTNRPPISTKMMSCHKKLMKMTLKFILKNIMKSTVLKLKEYDW